MFANAVRMLARNPGFTTVAVLTLALDISANSTIFSVVNVVLLRPLPFPDAGRLVTVWKGRISSPASTNIISLPNYRDWKERSHVFEGLAVLDSAGRGYSLTGGAKPEQVSGSRPASSRSSACVRFWAGRSWSRKRIQAATALSS